MNDFFSSVIHDPQMWMYLGAILFVLVATFSYRWRFVAQRLEEFRGKDWPTISASIDNVTVIEQIDNTGKGPPIITYLATLTYFYRNPDLQVGDYSREFGGDEREWAEDWTKSFKGKTVMVHVDPKDPTRSVLTKEEVLRNEPPY